MPYFSQMVYPILYVPVVIWSEIMPPAVSPLKDTKGKLGMRLVGWWIGLT
jgi:hypothetical protein